MNLDLPTPTVTIGPEWANDINAALTLVDSHDHTTGKGVKVPTSGLDINADLNFGDNKADNLKAACLADQGSPLAGASNARCLNANSGDLYYTNGSGVSIQLTSGGAIVSTPAAANSFETVLVNTNLVIGAAETFVYLRVDTTSTRSITLPLANAVVNGRIYILKDIDGQANANNITINTAGSDTIDGASTLVLSSDNETTWLIGDGTSSWSVS